MNSPLLTQETIYTILDVARLAPSVHNTQPWRVKVVNDSFIITLDPDHTLKEGDPTGRQTIISLGIFTAAIEIGSQKTNVKVASVDFKDKKVVMQFVNNTEFSKNFEPAKLLSLRHSDRSIYTPVEVSSNFMHAISGINFPGVQIRISTNRSFIKNIADLTAKGIRMALSNPNFRKELSRYLVLPQSTKRRGITVKSLYIPYLLAILQPWMVRLGLNNGAESKLEKKRWESASGVIVITGDGDMPQYWLEAGRAYLHCSLEIERAGLSQATSAAIVEASNFHEDIEELLNINKRILSILRIGKGSNKKHMSPRIKVEEIITLN